MYIIDYRTPDVRQSPDQSARIVGSVYKDLGLAQVN